MVKIKKLMCGLLALALVLVSAAGCAKKPEAPQPDNKAAAATPQAKKEPVKITMLLNSAQAPRMDDPIMKEIQKRSNTILEIEVPPATNYTEKLRLLLAGGDTLPDVIDFGSVNSNEFVQAKDAGLVIPVTKYFNEAKNLKANMDPRPLEAININNEIWGIPRGASTPYAVGFSIRSDWAKKLKIDVPTDGKPISIEKFLELCEAFTLKDPDGNGKNDTYGFDATITGTDTAWDDFPSKSIRNAFGAARGWVKDGSGTLVRSELTLDWDKYKKSLKFFRDLVAKKITHPDIFMSKNEIVRDRLYKGQIGVVCFGSPGSTIVSFLPNVKKVTPDAELVWVTGLYGEDGKVMPTYVGGTFEGGALFAVSKYCKDPGAVVRFFDWCATKEGQVLLHAGLEGTHYTLENGVPLRKTPEQEKAILDYKQWNLSTRFIVTKERSMDITFDFPNMGQDGKTIEKWWMLVSSSDYVKYNDDLGYRAPSTDKMTDINKELYTAVVKYSMGTSDDAQLDAARDKYINSAAYKAVQKEYNDWYQKRK